MLALKDQPTKTLRSVRSEYRIYIHNTAKAKRSMSPSQIKDLELVYEALEAVENELRKRDALVPRAYNPTAGRAKNPSLADAGDYIRNHRPFKASALSGVTENKGSGRLNDSGHVDFYVMVREAESQGPLRDNFYAVYSYSTPIAWWVRGHGWTIVRKTAVIDCSVTTSKHLSVVSKAIGNARVVNPRVRGEELRELKAQLRAEKRYERETYAAAIRAEKAALRVRPLKGDRQQQVVRELLSDKPKRGHR